MTRKILVVVAACIAALATPSTATADTLFVPATKSVCTAAHWSYAISVAPYNGYAYWRSVYLYTGQLVASGSAVGDVDQNFGYGATRYVCLAAGAHDTTFAVTWHN